MALPLQPNVRVGVVRTLVPSSEGTVTSLWSTKPLADPGEFAEGRVLSIGPIARRISSPDGDYQIPTCDVRLTDADGFFSGLLAGATTRYLTTREAFIELLSDAGRAASLEWGGLLRGTVTDIQAFNREATLRITDEPGSHFSGFNLELTIGVPASELGLPGMPEDSKNLILPIVLGEHTDAGDDNVDANGASADTGMLPFVDAGWVMIGDDDSVEMDETLIPRLAAPEDLTATPSGTAGIRTRRYGITFHTDVGETTLSQEQNISIADDLSVDTVTLAWTEPTGVAAVSVYVDGHRVETIDIGYLTWEDDQNIRPATGPLPPPTNGALLDQVINGVTFGVYRMLIAKIGAAAHIDHVYGSDLGSGAVPKRTRLPEAVYGTQVRVYGRGGYPHAEPYTERNGIRFAPMYARGPLLDQHLRGVVTFAWSGDGDDDIGDGSGDTITEAFYQLQHLLNEYVLKDGGIGYRTDLFGPPEEFSNGVSKLLTSAFESCQAQTIEWIGDRGYQGSIAIVTATSLREVLRRFAVTFACNYAPTNRWGQFYPLLISDTADPDAGPLYLDRVQVIRVTNVEYKHDQVETRVLFNYDWRVLDGTFRFTDVALADDLSTEAHGGVPRERSLRRCYYSRDLATVYDSNGRHLSRYKVAPRLVSFELDYTGIDIRSGEQFRFTSEQEGDVATPLVVVSHVINPHNPNTVVVTGFDLKRILAGDFGALQDDDTMDGWLFDDDVFAPPPDGAYRLH